MPGKAFQRQELWDGRNSSGGWRGREDREDHSFLLLPSLIACIEFRNYLPPPTLERLKPRKGSPRGSKLFHSNSHPSCFWSPGKQSSRKWSANSTKGRGTRVAPAGMAAQPVILVHGRLRHKDCWESWASLGYSETLIQRRKTKHKIEVRA